MPDIEITVKMNGKSVPLSTLSKETLLKLREESTPPLCHGDEVICPNGRKYIAIEQQPISNELNIWGKGYVNGHVKKKSTYYEFTGFNVFEERKIV